MSKLIDMNTDTFEELKTDMTIVLNRLLATMQSYGAEKAAMSVKVEVQLKKAVTDSGENVPVPEIKHKVSSTVQVKDEKEGEVKGYYALAKTEDGYSLVPLGEQGDIFDLIQND